MSSEIQPTHNADTSADAVADGIIEIRPEVSDAEAELVKRLKDGDDRAYEELVRSMTGRLLAVARRVSRTEADAEDAVQDAFLSAFKAIGTFDARSALSTWLHRIVVNAALMRARKAQHRHEVSVESLLPRFRNDEHAEPVFAWKAVTREAGPDIEQRSAVLAALDRLPDEYRTVIVLRDIEGMESKEVAASLGISDALVRQRLHRGRQALLKLLEPTMNPNAQAALTENRP